MLDMSGMRCYSLKAFIGRRRHVFLGASAYDKKCKHNWDSSYSDEEGCMSSGYVSDLSVEVIDLRAVLILGLALIRIGTGP